MAISFINGSEINLQLEYLIRDADDYLYLVCPYIKLHDRLKKELLSKNDQPHLKIVVVFGKNEEGLYKSLSKEDFDFLSALPHVEIRYEPKLHAKYYANEDRAIITSMNLHESSQNNNIEAGILMDVKGVLSTLIKGDNPELDAFTYFEKVIKGATLRFAKSPEFKKTMYGLGSEYIGSNITLNTMDEIYETLKPKPVGYKSFEQPKLPMGYCIRTGIEIPFDLKQPFGYKAFKSWQNFSNPDYPEKYCHYTGEQSNGETSFKSPILRKNWKEAKSKFKF